MGRCCIADGQQVSVLGGFLRDVYCSGVDSPFFSGLYEDERNLSLDTMIDATYTRNITMANFRALKRSPNEGLHLSKEHDVGAKTKPRRILDNNQGDSEARVPSRRNVFGRIDPRSKRAYLSRAR